MKEQLAISAAIIGASVVAAVVIAGGPSGIFPQDDAGSLTITTDNQFSPQLDEALLPSDPELDEPSTSVPDSSSDQSDTTDPDATDPANTAADDTTADDTTTTSERATTLPVRPTTVPGTTAPATTLPGTSQPSSPSTTAGDGLAPRDELSVAVANGAGISGIATTKVDLLVALGYVDPTPENAESFPYTLVMFPPGMDEEAARLAEDAGLLATSTLAFGNSPDIGVPETYDLVLVLGTDQRPAG